MSSNNNNDQNSTSTGPSSYDNYGKQFGQDGCQVILKSGNKCGEQQTLQICREFNQMYADKLKEIDNIGGGDCIEVPPSSSLFYFLIRLSNV